MLWGCGTQEREATAKRQRMDNWSDDDAAFGELLAGSCAGCC